MKILCLFHLQTGNIVKTIHDLNKPEVRHDIHKRLQNLVDHEEAEPEVTHWELFEVKQMSIDSVLKAIRDYPTSDLS